MEIHPIILIGSVIIPLFIVIVIMFWVIGVQKKSLKNQNELTQEKIKSEQKEKENKLWETLVDYKEKHIDLLQKKLKED